MQDVDAATEEALRHAGFAAVNAAFGSLGRVCIALDAQFRVRHASERLDDLVGPGAAASLEGSPIDALLGGELFGPAGLLRQALLAGEKREGWRASLRIPPAASRLVSVTAAPLRHDRLGVCDAVVAYLLVLRPAEEDDAAVAAPGGIGGVVARSPAMERVFRLVESLKDSEATILLTGESGTGKEVMARALHARSSRRGGPFVAVNCAALPFDLLESELFGHVRGAFTGAVRDRVGRFELAARGTLFLDEVGDLPVALQGKLLRVLQERTFERVGESRTLETDARIVAATHRDLKKAVRDGAFREDLFYRLRVFPIDLPALRNRREDIEPLARLLLARAGGRSGRSLRFSPDALRALLGYPWPGNVRELENAMEYAVTVARGQTLQPEDLPPEITAAPARGAPPSPESQPVASEAELPASGNDAERARLQAELEAHRWRRSGTAQALGISRTTLWRKMRELGLES